MGANPLRPYQEDCVAQSTLQGRQLIALVQGAGKTLTAIETIRQLRDGGGVVLNDPGLKGAVFCPASLKYQWKAEIQKWDPDATVAVIDGTKGHRTKQYAHANRYGTQYTVLNYDCLIHDWDAIRKYLNIDFIIADECFVAGTMVDTPSGRVPIESISVGDQVYNAGGVGSVVGVRTSQHSFLVRVSTEDGRRFICSAQHPVLTLTGWKFAATLMKNDDFICETAEALRMVQGVDQPQAQEEQVLRAILLSEMEDESPRSEGDVHVGTCCQDFSGTGAALGASIRAGEVRGWETYAGGVDPRNGSLDQGHQGSQRYVGSDNSWRQWASPYQGRTVVAGQHPPVGVELLHTYTYGKGVGVSTNVQSGSSSTKYIACGGVRRQLPPSGGTQISGSEEGSISGWARVVDVEVLESGHRDWPGNGSGGSTVCYDLQVSGHPSFSVEGLLVHNCTYIKGMAAKRSRRIKSMAKHARFRYALSGQPVENRPEELFSIMEFVDPTVFGDFRKFDNAFIIRDPWGRPTRYRNLHKLHEMLGQTMFRRSRDDIAEFLPDRIETVVPVPLDTKVLDAYVHIQRDLLRVIEEAVEQGMGTFNLDANYGQADPQGGALKGQIMSRITAMRLLCDHPMLLANSAAQATAEGPGGSAYAASLVDQGVSFGHESSKMAALVEMTKDILAEDPTYKVVVFSGYKTMLTLLRHAIRDACTVNTALITGDTPAEERQVQMDRFNNDPKCRVFLSSDAGQYGINLVAGSHLISYDLPWSAGALSQRTARIDRTSSVHRTINIIYMYTAQTIEERQYRMLTQKSKVADAFIDKKGFDTSGNMPLTLESLRAFLLDE